VTLNTDWPTVFLKVKLPW